MSKPRILVADDDEAVRNIARVVLEREGFAVQTAADGRAALAELERDPDIALVLLDWSMPEMDGAETLAEMRRRGLAIPVVLSTGGGDRPDADRLADVAGHLPKPYRPSELVAEVRRVLDRR